VTPAAVDQRATHALNEVDESHEIEANVSEFGGRKKRRSSEKKFLFRRGALCDLELGTFCLDFVRLIDLVQARDRLVDRRGGVTRLL